MRPWVPATLLLVASEVRADEPITIESSTEVSDHAPTPRHHEAPVRGVAVSSRMTTGFVKLGVTRREWRDRLPLPGEFDDTRVMLWFGLTW